MPRFSDKAAVRMQVIMSGDTSPNVDEIEDYSDLIDQCYILVAITSQNLTYQRFNLFETNLKLLKIKNNELNDDFFKLSIKVIETIYYLGFDHFPIDLDKGKQVFLEATDIFESSKFEDKFDTLTARAFCIL